VTLLASTKALITNMGCFEKMNPTLSLTNGSNSLSSGIGPPNLMKSANSSPSNFAFLN